MKTKLFVSSLCLTAMLILSQKSFAFDLSKLGDALKDGTVENIVNGVAASSNIDVKDIAGTWKYKAPAIAFESEDILKKAGGVAAATTIETKIAPYYKKSGITNLVVTFAADGTFTMTANKIKLSGTVTKESKNFVFKFKAIGNHNIGNIKTHIKKGTTLELTFDVSKLVKILSSVATKANNTSVNSAIKLLESYDGVCAGFELSK